MEEHIGWGKILKSSYRGQATKGWDHFLLGELIFETPRKQRFSFGNWKRARLDEMVKNGTEKDFIFHAIFPAQYPFW